MASAFISQIHSMLRGTNNSIPRAFAIGWRNWMPSQKVELLWMRNFSWKLTVRAATKCTLKVATPLPIRIATHDARAGMGLGDAVFAWRLPRNQSRDGMAFCGCARTAKKERARGVGVTAAHRGRPCGRDCRGNPGGGYCRDGSASAGLAGRRGGHSDWLRRVPHGEQKPSAFWRHASRVSRSDYMVVPDGLRSRSWIDALAGFAGHVRSGSES